MEIFKSTSIFEFQNKYPTERACKEYLYEFKWLQCGHTKSWGTLLNQVKPVKNVEKEDRWQNEIQLIGIDPATKKSHNEWHTDLLGKTTGSSPSTVTDHDIDSNWRGLGWGKTYRQAHKADGARVVSSVDWEDMPSHPGLRWRCHQYDESPQDNTAENCPWPPDENKKRYL